MDALSNYLNSLGNSGDESTAPVAIIKDPSMQSMMAYNDAFRRCTTSIEGFRSLSKDFAQMKCLRDAVATSGLSKSLAAYMNNDGNFQAVVPSFPSTESLNDLGYRANDPRMTKVLANIDTTLSNETLATKEGMKDIVMRLQTVLDATAQVVEEREDRAEAVADAIDEMAEGIEVDMATAVTSIPADKFKEILEELILVASEFADVPDFASEDGIEAVKAKVDKAVEKLASFIGLKAGDVVSLDPSAIAEDYVASESTLEDLGYTADVVAGILRQVATLVDAVENILDQKDAIVEAITSQVCADEAPAEQQEEPEEGGDDENEDDGADPVGTDDETEGTPSTEDADEEEEPSEGDDEPEEGENEEEEGTDEPEDENEEEEQEEDTAMDSCDLICSYITVLMAVVDASMAAVATISSVGSVYLNEIQASQSSDEETEEEEEEQSEDEPTGDDETTGEDEDETPSEEGLSAIGDWLGDSIN